MAELPLWENIKGKRLVLASASPRRKEIMKDMGLEFDVVTTLAPDENNPANYKTSEEYVADTALMKAVEVFERCKTEKDLEEADIVIGADTVVVIQDKILEKPRSEQEALRMIDQLSGKTHRVLTAVQILKKESNGYSQTGFVEDTSVTFSIIDKVIQEAYVRSGEPFDKAGGYGIQGSASLFVESINGDYWNVVGLPKNHLYRKLKAL
ncbi:N-acetylserotonin O-methyltransferase-like protein-like protein [Phycomyces nitens]|nr:N-acetylserotonin O-methyltransferase-like protein-like protein [Phycomyces nitens]